MEGNGRTTGSWRCIRAVAAVAAVGLVVAAALPSAAQAHAFLVRSSPPAGARLSSSPSQIVMFFSEPYVGGSEHVTLRRPNGTKVALAAPSGSGKTIRQPLPRGLRGVFVVSWTVLSAEDGHLSAGEFAFSAAASGALPSVAGSAAPTPWSQAIATWVFFVGLALAFGGLLSELVVWRGRSPRAPVGVGLVLSSVSSLALLVLLAGARENGGFAAGLNGEALRAAYATRPGALTLAVFGVLVVAAVPILADEARTLALLPVTAAAVLTSARGHSWTSGHWWAPAVDSIHLLGAAAWAGALVHLVLALVRAPDRATAAGPAIRRYSRIALPTVLVILATGVLSAFAEFRSVGAVFHTSYGQTLLVKTAIVLGALAAAGTSRVFALPTWIRSRSRLLRGMTATEAALVVAVLAAAGLFVNLAPPQTSAAQAGGVGPPPLTGPALRVAGFAGRVAVGLAASTNELEFTVMPPPGRTPSGYRLTADARDPDGKSTDLYPRPCGVGCFSIQYPLQAGTTQVTASISPPGSSSAEVRFDVAAPIPGARAAFLKRVVKTMRALPSVDVTETLSDGARSLGSARTYRLTGDDFVTQEAFDAGAVDARIVGHQGRLTELTLAAQDSSAWYRLWVDERLRLRREEIVGAGLLIRRTFAYPAAAALASAQVAASTIPTGPFVSAREDGDLAVAFAAEPAGRGRLRLTVTVIAPDGDGAAGLEPTIRLVSDTASRGPAAPCGPGCYRVTLPFAGTPRLGVVTINRLGHVPSTVRFDFPPAWPPPPAERLAREATRVFTRLRSLTIDEHLGSSPTNVVHTHWLVEAPDRLTYAIEGGPQAVVIGDRRWDRDPGGRWVESEQLPVTQPTPAWVNAPRQAALLGGGRVGDHRVWRVSFVEPDVPAWFTIVLDQRTLRTLDLRMTAAAHFMHHVYGDFNQASPIRPPR